MKNIGILGGTRFIGYHLVRTLLEAGHRITLFHRGFTFPPEPFPSTVNCFYGDRNRAEDLKGFMNASYDVVVDLSGHTPHHIQPFLTASYRANIRHYIFCSTSSVYIVPPPCPYDETARRSLVPQTYGGDKARAEDLLIEAWTKDRWPITIFRPQGVFGPFDTAQAGFVFSRLVHSFPLLLGQQRDFKMNFLYVKDLVSAFLLAMDSNRSHGKVYSIAGDEILTQRSFINLCGEATGIQPRVCIVEDHRYRNLPVGIPWLNYDLVADNRMIKEELGLRFTPMKKALVETRGWLQQEPDQLAPILLRGERYVLRNRSIPIYAKCWWKADDLTRSSTLRQVWLPCLIKLFKRSPILTKIWGTFKTLQCKLFYPHRSW